MAYQLTGCVYSGRFEALRSPEQNDIWNSNPGLWRTYVPLAMQRLTVFNRLVWLVQILEFLCRDSALFVQLA
jgi:hypothetical protein